ncbi:hypothetical protein Y032_0010g1173 [Ancylostoma ceylanicum]|uniref:Uncharacterized protein n=1 Tax=Ancylostoma ceylanicum TaxID=53326 RepID=A0A016VGQ0_9BILA|nr:hypothetical protein Y032_0010g1173 [Ancylostoma ceylanicum]
MLSSPSSSERLHDGAKHVPVTCQILSPPNIEPEDEQCMLITVVLYLLLNLLLVFGGVVKKIFVCIGVLHDALHALELMTERAASNPVHL